MPARFAAVRKIYGGGGGGDWGWGPRVQYPFSSPAVVAVLSETAGKEARE